MEGMTVSPLYGWAGAIAFTIFASLGIVGHRLAKGRLEGFMVMDRKANWFMIAGTFIATWISATTFVGMMAVAYNFGLPRSLWFYGSLIGLSLFPFFIGIPLRRARLVTVPDFFHYFWGSARIKVWATLVLVVAQQGILVSQALAIGKMFNIIYGISFEASVVIFMTIVALYVAIGGMWAVVLSDTLMFVTFIVATLIAVPFAYNYLGGFQTFTHLVPQAHPGVWDWDGPNHLPAVYFLGIVLMWIALTMSAPQLVSRAFVARSERDLVKGLAFGQVAVVIFLILLFTAGTAVYLHVPGLKDPDYAGIWFLLNPLPVPVGMGLVAAIVAAAVSTVNTIVMTVGQGVGRDIYQRFINPGASDAAVINVTRAGMVGACLIATLAALSKPDIVIMVFQWGTSIYLATFLPTLLASLFWRGATASGVFWGMVVGGILFPSLSVVERSLGGDIKFIQQYGAHAALYAAAAAFLTIFVISKLTKNSPSEQKHSLTFRTVMFPTGRTLSIAGKRAGTDVAWFSTILAVDVLFIAWYILQLVTS